jgi:phage regulator Rha-like protein
MTGLIIHLENNEPVISSIDIAKGMEGTHESVIKLIKKYETDLQEIKTFGFKIQKSKGRKTSYCNLNEEQTAFLITLMRNSKKVVSFKKRLTQEFFKMRKKLLELASRQQNAEWLENRKVGKITRREETDTIKVFVDYATVQGSKNANMYYSNITKMENKALFLLEQKFKNLRDILDLRQLATIDNADAIVTKALTDGMSKNIHYKEIYKLAKKRVEAFADLRGQTFIPTTQAEEQKQIEGKVA